MLGLLAWLGQCAQMIFVTLIGSIDQAFVKSTLVRPALVTSDK